VWGSWSWNEVRELAVLSAHDLSHTQGYEKLIGSARKKQEEEEED